MYIDVDVYYCIAWGGSERGEEFLRPQHSLRIANFRLFCQRKWTTRGKLEIWDWRLRGMKKTDSLYKIAICAE
jgi:hypothetical protein